MEMIVRRAGMQTSVQDLGRVGSREEGVPLSGAMDRCALRIANLLVGNDENAPALEFTLNGPDVEFSQEALVAVGGAEFGDIPCWRPIVVPANTRLSFGAARAGCRGYLAVSGGFEVPKVLGSASAYLRGGFGGGFGRALQEGDVLPVGASTRHVRGQWSVDPRILPAYSAAPIVRVVRGAQATEFGRPFFTAPYTVTSQSDRMGLRLKGPTLVRQSKLELHSGPVVPGTVQVPPDGQPIVLMADAQTLGGYPQIAHVIQVDLPLVAQARPGDTLSFREVAVEEAHELTLARERSLAMLRLGLLQKLS